MLETHMAPKHTAKFVDCRFSARPSRRYRQSIATVAVASALGSFLFEGGTACIRMPAVETTSGGSTPAKEGGPSYGPFKLKPDFAGPCARADVVDIDLGHTPETFVRAAHCQIT